MGAATFILPGNSFIKQCGMTGAIFASSDCASGSSTTMPSSIRAMATRLDKACESATPLFSVLLMRLAGADFFSRFNGSSVDDLVKTIRASMPQDAPDSLGTPAYVDLVGYLLKANGGSAGAAELSQDSAVLKQIRITNPK